MVLEGMATTENGLRMAEPQSGAGIVYVLTNDAMPNMIKIGHTLRERVEHPVNR